MSTNRDKVIEILNGYYGEDRVDVQNESTILIHWPEVTVTNENDRSIVIKELYALIIVTQDGTLNGTFRLNRSEYSCTEWFNHYMHSHVPPIYHEAPWEFSSSCLGGGPIRDTMTYLNSEFDEDFWTMFALELDKYVHTESLSGGPYKRIEELNRLPETCMDEIYEEITIGFSYSQYVDDSRLNRILALFIPYMIGKKPFLFTFNDRFLIADSNYNIIVKTSNLFIEWFNGIEDEEEKINIKDFMFESKYLGKYKAHDGEIFRLEERRHDYAPYREINGRRLWEFKGHDVYLNITGIPDEEEIPIVYDPFTSTLLKPSLVLYITGKILNVINRQYGRKKEHTGTDKKTLYLSTYNPYRSGAEDSSSLF